VKTTIQSNNLGNAYFSPTTNNSMGNIFYVMKLDSRVKGPWSDTDEKPKPMPRQLKNITQLYPYQQEIIDRVLYNWDNRSINLLYDKEGCSGKSTLALYCMYHKIGRRLPLSNEYKEIMANVMCMPESGLYFIDMPRSINKNKLREFYAGIETLKDGYAYDTRYKFTDKFFNSPEIWIFSNNLPKFKELTKQRWKIWVIQDNELFRWNFGEPVKGDEIRYPVDDIVECEEEAGNEEQPPADYESEPEQDINDEMELMLNGNDTAITELGIIKAV
jgi:hypothetical protein